MEIQSPKWRCLLPTNGLCSTLCKLSQAEECRRRPICHFKILGLCCLAWKKRNSDPSCFVRPYVSAVLYPKELWPTAKQFWQHTGEGISSRRAEYCHRALDENIMIESSGLSKLTPQVAKGPKRYQRPSRRHHSANGFLYPTKWRQIDCQWNRSA